MAHPQPIGRGLRQNLPGHLPFAADRAQHGQHLTGSALFHGTRRGVGVQRARLEQLFAGKGQRFGRHIVNVAHQFGDLSVCSAGTFTPKGAHTVGLSKILSANAHADLFGTHHRHVAEFPGKMGQQRGSGRGTQLATHRAAIRCV